MTKYIYFIAILFLVSCKVEQVETPNRPFQKEGNYYKVPYDGDEVHCRIVRLDKCDFVVCSNITSMSIYPYGNCNPDLVQK